MVDYLCLKYRALKLQMIYTRLVPVNTPTPGKQWRKT